MILSKKLCIDKISKTTNPIQDWILTAALQNFKNPRLKPISNNEIEQNKWNRQKGLPTNRTSRTSIQTMALLRGQPMNLQHKNYRICSNE